MFHDVAVFDGFDVEAGKVSVSFAGIGEIEKDVTPIDLAGFENPLDGLPCNGVSEIDQSLVRDEACLACRMQIEPAGDPPAPSSVVFGFGPVFHRTPTKKGHQFPGKQTQVTSGSGGTGCHSRLTAM